MSENKRGGFTSSIGFVLAAAGSAVGLGNLWRFPYLAAKDGGGLFLVVYLVLVLTFGFALMTTEIAIGRKTQKSPVSAFTEISKKWSFVGWGAVIVPSLILPYYSVIGGWVCKYAFTYITGHGADAVDPNGGFFYKSIGLDTATGSVSWQPIFWFMFFLLATSVIVYFGVDKGIERVSKILMPALFIIVIFIAGYSLTLKDPDSGRTAIDGLKIYLIPNFKGMTVTKFLSVVLDAMGQMFYSLSLAMGIMITYGSYMKKDSSMPKSINQIEFCDTGVALLAGLIMVPTVFCFLGSDGLSAAGPSLMFISLPQVFAAMGSFGNVIGSLFFLLVIFAALTSCISIMEAVASVIIDKFGKSRHVAVIISTAMAMVIGLLVCLGYNKLFFSATFASVSGGQLLDILDWFTNNLLMPIVAIFTCIVAGYVLGTDKVLEEVQANGEKFPRAKIYVVMTKYVSPILLLIILLNSFGVFKFLG